MLSSKLGKLPMRQEVYNYLLEAIISGQLEPGKQLDEKEISESLGVSRTPLREALNRLAQEGIVNEIPYRGNFVKQFSAKDIKDLYEVRKNLEVMAVRSAVLRMTEAEAEEISALVRLTAEAQEAKNMADFASYDAQFHEKLALYAGNQVLYQMLASMGSQIKIVRSLANKSDKVVKQSQFDREHILGAIATRNPDAAAQFMEAHIDHVMKEVIERLGHEG
ncbi:GntR family transcriptional regulator [Paenibacillus sp. GCM10023252]|uniref:GntR family transcriptional regulator n=1 Tax=Paenibacillus sp. GCM10023252 TaxID=3252649 RepID=UPI003620B39B